MIEARSPRFATLAIHGGGADAAVSAATIEQRVALLEGGSAAVAVGSGALLLGAALQPLMRPGGQAVVAREAASPSSLRDIEQRFTAFGWEVRWAEIDEPASFERAVSPKTQAIMVAAVAASGEVADVVGLASTAKRAQVPLIVDNSVPTPAL